MPACSVNDQLNGSFGMLSINCSIERFSKPTSLVASYYPLKEPSTFHMQVWCDESLWTQQWVTVWHWSLWLQPLRSGNRRPTALTRRLWRPENRCGVDPDSSPESQRVVGIEINFDPVWKGNLPVWWRGHTTSLLDWHEWLTPRFWTHDPSYTCVILINVENDLTHCYQTDLKH